MQKTPSYLILVSGAACFLALSSAAIAHHSTAGFDRATDVLFRGTVTELEWRNPHIMLTLETEDENGAPRLQEFEFFAVSEARALGLSEDAISPGTSVVVRAYLSRRDPDSRALGVEIETADGTAVELDLNASSIVPTVEAAALSGRWVPLIEDLVTAGMGAWPFKDEFREAVGRVLTEPGLLVGICEQYPPPFGLIFPDLREIEIGDDVVSIHYEAQGLNIQRVIDMGQTVHPDNVAPSLVGHSIGWWEGETLVIDTVAFSIHALGIYPGVPSGPDKHLIERLTLAENGLYLQYEFELDDPSALTGPATLSMRWAHRPDLDFSGVPCDPEVARRLVEDLE